MSWELLGRDFLSSPGSGKHFNRLYCSHAISKKKKNRRCECPRTSHALLNLSLKISLDFNKVFSVYLIHLRFSKLYYLHRTQLN